MAYIINVYASLFERHRWLVALLVVAATGIAVNALPGLRTSDNLWDLFMARGEGKSTSKGADINDNICLVALKSDELFTPDGMAIIRDLHTSLSDAPGVDRVTSLCDIRKPVAALGRRRIYRDVFPNESADAESIAEFHKLAAEHPMVKGQLLSDDGRATLILVELDPAFRRSIDFRPVIERIERQVAERTRDTNFDFEVTGPTVVQIRGADALIKDQLIFNIAGPIMAIFISFVLFRRPSAVLIVTAAPILGVVWTLGWFALSGEELNPINGVVAPLALTIGLTDAVHMLLHIRQEIATGKTPHDAAGLAIRQVGAACLLTSLTTAIGFASLATAEFQVLRDFGIDCAAGVVMAFVAVLTVVPLLGSTPLGKRTVPKDLTVQTGEAPKRRLAGSWYTHAIRFSLRNRWSVCVGSTLLTLFLIWYAQGLQLDVRIRRGLPTGSPTQQAFLDVDELFGGSLPFTLVVNWSPDDPPEPDELVEVMTAVHNLLAGSGINSPPLSILSIFEMIPGANRSPERLVGELQNLPDERFKLFYDYDAGRARVVARFRDVGSDKIERLLNEIDATLPTLAAEHPGFRFSMPDSPPTGLRSASGILFDLLDSLFLAVPVTMLIIAMALRSLRLGFNSLLPNIFPMAALAATMLILNIPLQLTGATVFVMCFGIAVDDTIHALTVYKRLTEEGLPTFEAIERGFTEIGDAIISTTVILIAGISVVMLGQSVMTKFFGGLFIGGLLWAFVGDLLLLPAMMACFPLRRHAEKEVADS